MALDELEIIMLASNSSAYLCIQNVGIEDTVMSNCLSNLSRFTQVKWIIYWITECYENLPKQKTPFFSNWHVCGSSPSSLSHTHTQTRASWRQSIVRNWEGTFFSNENTRHWEIQTCLQEFFYTEDRTHPSSFTSSLAECLQREV